MPKAQTYNRTKVELKYGFCKRAISGLYRLQSYQSGIEMATGIQHIAGETMPYNRTKVELK